MGLRVRPARKSDKVPLMKFIKNVWGGHDYIPRVWDDWMKDKSARMFVVDADGIPIAMNRVRFLEDGSAWFEGVRVHPDYWGRGVATMLGENSMSAANQRGVRIFRLTSSSWNKRAHRQIARMHFHEVARFSVYQPKKGSRFRRQGGVRRASAEDVVAVHRAIAQSEEYALGHGVMWDNFTAISLSQEVVAARIAERSLHLLDGAIAISKPGREGDDLWDQVCFLSGKPNQAVALVKHLFSKSRRVDWKFVVVPQRSALIPALRGGGMERAFSIVLFEKKAANG